MLSKEGYGLLPIPEALQDHIDSFDCGKVRLNEFLKAEALELHKSLLSFTSLVFHEDYEGLVGFFTLSHDGIPLSDVETFELGYNGSVNLNSFPSVKIGRFGIQKALQGKGIGGQIMEIIRGDVIDSKSLSSARVLIVDADNDPQVIRFYEKHGFERSQWAAKQAFNHGKKSAPYTVKLIRDVMR